MTGLTAAPAQSLMQRLTAHIAGEPDIVEIRRGTRFVPAHPRPHETRPGGLKLLAGARRNLISIWTRADYRSGSGTARIFGRQITLAGRPEDVKYVLATGHQNFERKSPQMRRALSPLLGDGLFISEGATWTERRPLVAEIVHKTRMADFAPVIADKCAELIARWQALPSGALLDAQTEMASLTADIIAEAVFGDRLRPGDARAVVDGFTTYQNEVDATNFSYFLGLDNGLPTRQSRRLKAAIASVHGVIDRVIADTRADGRHGFSLIDGLSEGGTRRLTREALRHEAATIFMGGHETTASTLTWIWYLLSHAPSVERAVHREIDRVCGQRAPGLADFSALVTCRAVVEEALRLYPPVPILARQALAADRIGDIEVDAASLVLVSPWLLHRQRGLWEKPNDFLPQRFLKGRPVPYSYIPFAAGPRNCAGQSFGLTEAVLALASLAQRFVVRVAEGHRVVPVCRLTLRPAGGLPVRIAQRI